jgi:hypothetical protein
MKPSDAANQLRELASRVLRLAPLSGNPEKFFEDRSEVAQDMFQLAGEFAAPQPAPTESVATSERRHRPSLVEGVMVIKGRRIAVQTRRMPFKVYVG